MKKNPDEMSRLELRNEVYTLRHQNESLESEVKRLSEENRGLDLELGDRIGEVGSLGEENEGLKEDAMRYRWLKENHLQLGPDCWIRTGDDLDDATDAGIRNA